VKWITCLNENTPLHSIYEEMLRVAVLSCQKFTDLEPIFIYDGKRNRLTDWMESQNVKVLFHQSTLKNKIEFISQKVKNPFLSQVGCGAFLRADIPRIAIKNGWPDKFVFYTDCDVMFVGNVEKNLNSEDCKLFSVAPENEPNQIDTINTGSMLMNIHNLYECDKEFKKFITKNLSEFLSSAWDQTAYIKYFHKRWSYLNPLLNWKPYWGFNRDAKIIHFHGLKPHHRKTIESGEIEDSFKKMICSEFYKYCDIYDRY
jgi:hypothetical protein